jgi:hypothetical protein
LLSKSRMQLLISRITLCVASPRLEFDARIVMGMRFPNAPSF